MGNILNEKTYSLIYIAKVFQLVSQQSKLDPLFLEQKIQ